MRSNRHIQREFWASAFLLASLVAFMGMYRLYVSWYDTFFEAIATYGIHSYRLVTIVTPEFCHDGRFIDEVRDFSLALEKKSLVNPDLKTQIEFWMSPKCSEKEVADFRSAIGGGEDFYYLPLTEVLQRQTRDGLPAVLLTNPLSELTENFLKIWTLDGPFDLNIFLDPKLWRRYGMKRASIGSAAAFGVLAKAESGSSFFINFIFPPKDRDNPRIMWINNEALIGTQNSQDVRTVKKLMISAIERNEDEIRRLLTRPLELNGEKPVEPSAYQREIERRLEWHKTHREVPLQDCAWISQLSGAMFLNDVSSLLSVGSLYTILHRDPDLQAEQCFTKKYSTWGQIERRFGSQVAKRVECELIRNDLALLQPQSVNTVWLQERLDRLKQEIPAESQDL